jgi:hypothetical protein
LLSVTIVTASLEMLLTGPDVAALSPCTEPELPNAAPLGLDEGSTPTGFGLSEHCELMAAATNSAATVDLRITDSPRARRRDWV